MRPAHSDLLDFTSPHQRLFFLSFVCPSSVSLSFSSSVSLELVLVGLNRGPCRHSCVRLELNKKARVSSKSVVCVTWKVVFRLIISGSNLLFFLCVACRWPCVAHCSYFVLYSGRVGRWFEYLWFYEMLTKCNTKVNDILARGNFWDFFPVWFFPPYSHYRNASDRVPFHFFL